MESTAAASAAATAPPSSFDAFFLEGFGAIDDADLDVVLDEEVVPVPVPRAREEVDLTLDDEVDERAEVLDGQKEKVDEIERFRGRPRSRSLDRYIRPQYPRSYTSVSPRPQKHEFVVVDTTPVARRAAILAIMLEER
jgi:hypothetical protein